MQVSLSARDRQALDLIEEGLAGADPRFAAKLSAFSRLTDGGEMPARERIQADTRPTTLRGLPPHGLRPGRRKRPRRPSTGAAVTVLLLISLAVISVALVLGHSGAAAACPRHSGAGCANRAVPSAPRVPAGQTGFLGP
jgi:hypothetical protein